MADEIALIKRGLVEELGTAEQKMLTRYENAIKSKLIDANELGQVAGESMAGGFAGLAAAKLTGGAVRWLRKKGMRPIGSQAADIWAGLANLGLGAGVFVVNAAIQTRPVPGALRQSIRAGSTITFFQGVNELSDWVADWLIADRAKTKAALDAAKKQKELAEQQPASGQPAAPAKK